MYKSDSPQYALVDNRARQMLDRPLRDLGLRPIYMPPSSLLAPPIDSHPDMRCAVIGRKVFCSPGDESVFSDIKDIDITSCLSVPRGGYPGDAAYNCLIIGGRLVHNLRYTDKTILDYAKNTGMTLVHAEQGYAGCSACVVDSGSAITSDKGIHATLVKSGVDCLLISEGHVQLDGYGYGFIGGASGLLDERILLFTGDIGLHPDYQSIRSFVTSKGVNIICLTDLPLFDIGRIFVF